MNVVDANALRFPVATFSLHVPTEKLNNCADHKLRIQASIRLPQSQTMSIVQFLAVLRLTEGLDQLSGLRALWGQEREE